MLKDFTLVADPGNYELKFFDGEQPRAIRSIQFQLPQGRRPVDWKPNSPLVGYQGKLYHLGVKAYEYRRQTHLVEGDKTENILLSVLACSDFPVKEFGLSIHMSSPNPTPRVVENIKKRLQGCHIFARNGRSYIAHIENITVEPEGVGAWRYAKDMGLIPSRGYTVLIDIGGGTCITRLMSPSGEILDGSVDLKGGIIDLATSISFDDRLIDVIGTHPKPGVILDGLTDGNYYGEMPRATWGPWFEEDHLKPWLWGILKAVQSQYAPQRSRIVKFVLAGGGSLLVADKVSKLDGFAVVPNPRFANLLGMLAKEGDRAKAA